MLINIDHFNKHITSFLICSIYPFKILFLGKWGMSSRYYSYVNQCIDQCWSPVCALFLKMRSRDLLGMSIDTSFIYPMLHLIAKCLFWPSEHTLITSIENMSKEYSNLLLNFYSDPYPLYILLNFQLKPGSIFVL